MNYLMVVAHPDDEVLGAGATIKKLTEEGHRVDLCIMSSAAQARTQRPADGELNNDLHTSAKLLGIECIYEGSFENIKMNNAPHLELVQFIEKAIIKSQAEVVITHHFADTNNDHMHTSMACQAAVRLFQRRTDAAPLKNCGIWRFCPQPNGR